MYFGKRQSVYYTLSYIDICIEKQKTIATDFNYLQHIKSKIKIESNYNQTNRQFAPLIITITEHKANKREQWHSTTISSLVLVQTFKRYASKMSSNLRQVKNEKTKKSQTQLMYPSNFLKFHTQKKKKKSIAISIAFERTVDIPACETSSRSLPSNQYSSFASGSTHFTPLGMAMRCTCFWPM